MTPTGRLRAVVLGAIVCAIVAVSRAQPTPPNIYTSGGSIVLSVAQTANVFVDRPTAAGGTERVAVFDLLSRVQQLESALGGVSSGLSQVTSDTATLSVNTSSLGARMDTLNQQFTSAVGDISGNLTAVSLDAAVLQANASTLSSRVDALERHHAAEEAAQTAGNYSIASFGRTRFTVFPNNVMSATCVASSSREPNCPGDDRTNAKKVMESFPGSVVFTVASSGTKTYTHVYDLGVNASFVAVNVGGSSTGHWCEGSSRGARNCHNDNVFRFSFSSSPTSRFVYPSNVVTDEACNDLSDGCRVRFDAVFGQFLRVEVSSSCSGCQNQDTVRYYAVEAIEESNANSSQFIVTDDGRVGVNNIDPQATLDVMGTAHVHGGPLRASGDARRPSLIVEALKRTTVQPQRVVSATCFATKNYNSANASNPHVDPRNPEPACPLDDTSNAQNGIQGVQGSVQYVIARYTSNAKYYEHVFDMGTNATFVGISLIGTSTGCWVEDGATGGCSYEHNDNSFSLQLSIDNVTYATPQLAHTHEACNNIADGCIIHFNATYARYLKLSVRSGCHGCNNIDYISEIHLIRQQVREALSVDNLGDLYLGGRKVVVRSDNVLTLAP